MVVNRDLFITEFYIFTATAHAAVCRLRGRSANLRPGVLRGAMGHGVDKTADYKY